MARIQWRTFDRGLWLAGGRDNVPDGGLRRATGVSQLREGAIRSVRGFRNINLFGANQYRRFADVLWQSAGADILRNGIVVGAAFPQSGLLGQVADGRRVSFLRAPPQPEITDYLFIGGGNNPFKITADGVTASKWGIDAPPDGFTAASDLPTGNTKLVDACDSAVSWTAVDGTAPADEGTIAIGGITSMRFDFADAGTRRYTKAVTTNLNHFGVGPPPDFPSADQDYIELWVRLTGTTAPTQPLTEYFDNFEIAFSLGNTDFSDNVLTRQVSGTEGVVPTAGLADQKVGVASFKDANNDGVNEADVVNSTGIFGAGADTRELLNAIGQTSIFRQADVWQRLRLPKITFERTGGDPDLNWADVQAIRLTFKVAGPVTVLVDQISLAGGFGLVGNYKYQVTFKNSTTGSRSNPNENAVLIKGIDRGRVVLGNLPVSADPQVDTVEVWRTVGNGEALFFAFEVANGDSTEIDDVVDFRGLYTGFGYLTDDELPDVLQPDELQLDNDPPPATIHNVLPEPHLARAWWLDSADGQQGRIFYSPAGRPESNQGFVEVTNTDNALQKPVMWNGVIHVFSVNGLFRILGDDEPFTSEEVFGVPGTIQPDTVRVTPFGICYQAADGPRLFDGSFSQPLSFDAVAPLFRGYDVEDTEAFVGVTAAYFNEDFYISDNSAQTFVYNLRTQAWRFLQLFASTLYASDDEQEIIAAAGFDTGLTVEVEAVEADIANDFEIELGARLVSADIKGLVQRLFIDIETGGLDVTPTLLIDDVEETLPVVNSATRITMDYALIRLARLVSVRLTAEVETELIVVYGVEMDVYVPAGSESAPG